MKKIYPIIAIFITILGSIINIISYKISDTILLGISIHGGEITQKIGFGTICDIYYPLTADPNNSVSTNLYFSILNFLICFIIIFGIVLLIGYLISRKNNKGL